ncbi:hypothetical protein [Succiniclasticum ruminis]|uniref:Uncharacterized protein n=1 Tax=Succiniclasticum ruminis DSM 9236 TaxID=1123323 RepID=A0A1I2DTU8_9FIRM|nr:hypothetical protein [Succiniclasticum ruminis]SFE83350.1 hypothetical protein SAMN05216245_12311 [Succiniclasticum ruminis DSM 9236]
MTDNDCLSDEIDGSINAAYWDGLITIEVAEYLRGKNFGIEDPYRIFIDDLFDM